MAVVVQRFGGLSVGVGVEQPVERSKRLGLRLAHLIGRQGDGHDQADGLPASEPDVQVDLVGLEDGDVLEEKTGDALALSGRSIGV